jgi:hypothetical protein
LRSLRTVKGARIELARLYGAVRRGEVDPNVGSVCRAILWSLIASWNAIVVDERLTALEQRIGVNKARVNGHTLGRPDAPSWSDLPPQ